MLVWGICTVKETFATVTLPWKEDEATFDQTCVASDDSLNESENFVDPSRPEWRQGFLAAPPDLKATIQHEQKSNELTTELVVFCAEASHNPCVAPRREDETNCLQNNATKTWKGD